MSALVVYATRYGSTERRALEIAATLRGAAMDLRTRDRELRAALEAADTVVVGGPIYGGRILGSVSRFCERHRELLLARRVLWPGAKPRHPDEGGRNLVVDDERRVKKRTDDRVTVSTPPRPEDGQATDHRIKDVKEHANEKAKCR